MDTPALLQHAFNTSGKIESFRVLQQFYVLVDFFGLAFGVYPDTQKIMPEPDENDRAAQEVYGREWREIRARSDSTPAALYAIC